MDNTQLIERTKHASGEDLISTSLVDELIAALEALQARVKDLEAKVEQQRFILQAARPVPAAPTVPEGWQPIETAPTDGTLIVVRGNHYGDPELGQHHCIAKWFNDCWMEASDWNATGNLQYLTHWTPLPLAAAPTGEQATPTALELMTEYSNGRQWAEEQAALAQPEPVEPKPAKQRVLVGTIGHIDSGKTTLTAAIAAVLSAAAKRGAV